MKTRLSGILGWVFAACISKALHVSAFHAILKDSRFSTIRIKYNNYRSTSNMQMVPRFDPLEQRWYPGDESDTEGYGPIGSLLRQGPKSFFSRITNPDGYEQGVYKMMAQEGYDRNEAQGNMDAYIENPNDWIFQKQAEKNGAPKYDYSTANTDPQSVILTSIWGGIVFWYVFALCKNIVERSNGVTSAGSFLPFL